MATNLAINQLSAKTPASTDIVPVADPSTGVAGKSLVSDIVNYGLPSQTGNSGKFLTTNGTISSWASILGSVNYQGTWDASTNTPSLASGVGTKGYYYVVSTDGSTNLDGVTTWKVGDWAIYNGTAWQKVDNTDAVASVNGQTGTVVLGYSDVGSPSTSGTNATGTWAIDITGNSANVTGIVAVANGGTGTSNGSITGTGALTFAAGGTNQNVTISPSGTGIVTIDNVPISDGASGTKFNIGIGGSNFVNQTSGNGSVAVGYVSLNKLTTGIANTGVGGGSGIEITTGQYNFAGGYYSLQSLTTGSTNTGAGVYAGQSITTADYNTLIGAFSLSQNVTGSENVAVGYGSATYQSNGSTVLTSASNSVYIGARCRGFDNSDTNTIVIGYEAIGKGANTTVLGNSSTTQTWLGGGELRLPGSISGYVGLKGAATAGSVTYTLPSADGTSGQMLSTNGSGVLSWSTVTSNPGTVTSVGGTGTVNGITLTGTVTSSGNLTLGGTLSNVSLTTQVTGTLPIANGGTGQTTAQAGINALAGATTSGQYLRGNGTNVVMSAIQAGDVPTLNQNTTGTAGNVTGTVAIANGGTGQTTAANAINALLPTQTSNSGKFLTTNGTAASWATVAASPAGSSGQVQYNSSGSFAGASRLTIQSNGWPTITDGTTYNNIGIGNDCLSGVITNSFNSAFGHSSLKSSTNAAYCTSFGYKNSEKITTGGFNCSFGASSLNECTTGQTNTVVGTFAVGNLTNGSQNTCVGYASGNSITSGSFLDCFGWGAEPSSGTASGETTLGNPYISVLRSNVTSITSLSDARDKTNITPMPSVLSFIASLNPVRFDWWKRDGTKVGVSDYGFIAQELQQAQNSTGFDWAQLVYESNPDKLEASPGKLIPILVKAIQELAAKVAALEAAV